jgi:hypothetical protein
MRGACSLSAHLLQAALQCADLGLRVLERCRLLPSTKREARLQVGLHHQLHSGSAMQDTQHTRQQQHMQTAEPAVVSHHEYVRCSTPLQAAHPPRV